MSDIKWRGFDESRRATPWDRVTRNPMQDFIKENYDDAYKSRHLSPSDTNEIPLINSIVPSKCPYCISPTVIKRGKNEFGIQRYMCKECNKRFIPTTGTIFDGHKIPIKDWIDFSLSILRYVSISADSWANRNAFKTSRYWLQKLFLVVEDYPPTIALKSRVCLMKHTTL